MNEVNAGLASPERSRWVMASRRWPERKVAMPEPGDTGSVEESFRCPHCGNMYATDGKDEGDCPVCGTHCTRSACTVLDASDVDF